MTNCGSIDDDRSSKLDKKSKLDFPGKHLPIFLLSKPEIKSKSVSVW